LVCEEDCRICDPFGDLEVLEGGFPQESLPRHVVCDVAGEKWLGLVLCLCWVIRVCGMGGLGGAVCESWGVGEGEAVGGYGYDDGDESVPPDGGGEAFRWIFFCVMGG